MHRAACPSGASTGVYEALELRDGGSGARVADFHVAGGGAGSRAGTGGADDAGDASAAAASVAADAYDSEFAQKSRMSRMLDELEEIETAFMQERAELMSANKEELYALMKKRGDKEEQYMEARRRRVDEDQRQLEAQRVQDLEDYNILKIKLETIAFLIPMN